MAANKIPSVNDALASPALGAGVGMLFVEFVKTVPKRVSERRIDSVDAGGNSGSQWVVLRIRNSD
jgi:hypothetical protein